jgi:hypothetical protein
VIERETGWDGSGTAARYTGLVARAASGGQSVYKCVDSCSTMVSPGRPGQRIAGRTAKYLWLGSPSIAYSRMGHRRRGLFTRRAADRTASTCVRRLFQDGEIGWSDLRAPPKSHTPQDQSGVSRHEGGGTRTHDLEINRVPLPNSLRPAQSANAPTRMLRRREPFRSLQFYSAPTSSGPIQVLARTKAGPPQSRGIPKTA